MKRLLLFALAGPALATAAVALEPLEQGGVASLGPFGAHLVWVPDRLFAHSLLFDGDSGKVLGSIDAGAVLTPKPPLYARGRGEIYSVDTAYSRGRRGERVDFVTIYDPATLAVRGEILLPTRTAESNASLAYAEAPRRRGLPGLLQPVPDDLRVDRRPRGAPLRRGDRGDRLRGDLPRRRAALRDALRRRHADRGVPRRRRPEGAPCPRRALLRRGGGPGRDGRGAERRALVVRDLLGPGARGRLLGRGAAARGVVVARGRRRPRGRLAPGRAPARRAAPEQRAPLHGDAPGRAGLPKDAGLEIWVHDVAKQGSGSDASRSRTSQPPSSA